jgi:hypothetical protein
MRTLLGTYGGGSFQFFVYDQAIDGAHAVANELALPSQYHESTLALASMPGQRTEWLVIESTGMHGTAIGQRVLFVVGWNGDRFRTVAAESLDYRCSRPTSPDQREARRRVFHRDGPHLIIEESDASGNKSVEHCVRMQAKFWNQDQASIAPASRNSAACAASQADRSCAGTGRE